jgi:hypothetical protein
MRSGLWTECAHYVSQVHNITIKAGKEMCPYEELMKKRPLFIKNLKIFGEACVRTVRKGLQDKLDNKGDICFFVGYPTDHYHDTFRLFNMETKKVVESRDVRWLNQMYREESVEMALVAVISDPEEPKSFRLAWDHSDLTERDGWRTAIQTELSNMEKRKVWDIVDFNKVPKGRK